MSQESEQQLLAALLTTKELHLLRAAGVEVDWFQDLGCQSTYSVILEYAKQNATQGHVPSPEYLKARMVPVPPMYNPASGTLLALLDVLRLNRLKMKLGLITQETTLLMANDPVAAHTKLLAGLMDQGVVGLMDKGKADSQAEVAQRLLGTFIATKDTQGMVGVPTPFDSLNYSLKGLQKGDMYCLFAPPKSMKSFIALLFALKVVATGKRVLFVTSEMPSEQCGLRYAAMSAGFNLNKWRDREMSVEEAEVILTSDPHGLMHYYQPTGLQDKALGEVYAEIQRLNWDGNLGLVIWDGHYRSAKSSEWNDMYNFVQATRAMALDKSLGQVPFLVVTQEGSKKGESSYKCYEREASLMLYLRRETINRIHAFTQALRDGLTLEFKILVDMTTGAPKFIEQQAKFLDGPSTEQGFA